MAEISAALVKTLRERTGAGMMDCKRALQQNDGELESAIDWLRTQGLSAAAKRAGRVAADGLVGLHVEGRRGALVEVNSETDFVARNALFCGFVQTVSRMALEADGDVERLRAMEYPAGAGGETEGAEGGAEAGGEADAARTVADRLTHLIATVGENMALRRCATLGVQRGVVGAYLHGAQGDGIGRIGVLVGVEGEGSAEELTQFGKQLAMHIAAANPLAIARDGLDAAVVDRERRIAREQAEATGKPPQVIDKIVEGRLAKFFQEACLVDQAYVLDPETKVGKVIEAKAAALGSPIAVGGFVRFALGEGVDGGEA
jgi:elongation factor Ts